MFDGIITQYVERFRPHLLSAQDEWRSWADRVLLGLGAIEHAVSLGLLDADEQRQYPNVAAQAATGQELVVVPANETWLLEAVSFVGGAASLLAIRNGGRLLWARSMAANDSQPGNDVVVLPGSIVTLDASTAGEVTAQFRRRMPRAHNRPNIGGQPITTDPSAPPMDQQTILDRHGAAYPIGRELRKVG